jgi:hypothetical protein
MAADSWGLSWGGTLGSWGFSWATGVTPSVSAAAIPSAGGGWKHRRRLFLFPDGTLQYCNEVEAYALAAEMNMKLPAKQVAPKPVPVTQKSTAVVPRQQLIGFLKSPSIPDAGPARRQVAQLIKRLRENERRIKEEEELEEIVLLLTILH